MSAAQQFDGIEQQDDQHDHRQQPQEIYEELAAHIDEHGERYAHQYFSKTNPQMTGSGTTLK